MEYDGGPCFWDERDSFFMDWETAIYHIADEVEKDSDIPDVLFACEEIYPTFCPESVAEDWLNSLCCDFSGDTELVDFISKEDDKAIAEIFAKIKPELDAYMKDKVGFALWHPDMKNPIPCRKEIEECMKQMDGSEVGR